MLSEQLQQLANALTDDAVRRMSWVIALWEEMGLSGHIAPVSGGGVQIEGQIGARELEIEVLPDGRLEYLRCVDGDAKDEGMIDSITDCANHLAWLKKGESDAD